MFEFITTDLRHDSTQRQLQLLQCLLRQLVFNSDGSHQHGTDAWGVVCCRPTIGRLKEIASFYGTPQADCGPAPDGGPKYETQNCVNVPACPDQ